MRDAQGAAALAAASRSWSRWRARSPSARACCCSTSRSRASRRRSRSRLAEVIGTLRGSELSVLIAQSDLNHSRRSRPRVRDRARRQSRAAGAAGRCLKYGRRDVLRLTDDENVKEIAARHQGDRPAAWRDLAALRVIAGSRDCASSENSPALRPQQQSPVTRRCPRP